MRQRNTMDHANMQQPNKMKLNSQEVIQNIGDRKAENAAEKKTSLGNRRKLFTNVLCYKIIKIQVQ